MNLYCESGCNIEFFLFLKQKFRKLIPFYVLQRDISQSFFYNNDLMLKLIKLFPIVYFYIKREKLRF